MLQVGTRKKGGEGGEGREERGGEWRGERGGEWRGGSGEEGKEMEERRGEGRGEERGESGGEGRGRKRGEGKGGRGSTGEGRRERGMMYCINNSVKTSTVRLILVGSVCMHIPTYIRTYVHVLVPYHPAGYSMALLREWIWALVHLVLQLHT